MVLKKIAANNYSSYVPAPLPPALFILSPEFLLRYCSRCWNVATSKAPDLCCPASYLVVVMLHVDHPII